MIFLSSFVVDFPFNKTQISYFLWCFVIVYHLGTSPETSPETSPLSQAFVRKLLVQLLESTTTNAKAPMRQRCEHIFNQHRSLGSLGSLGGWGKLPGKLGETMGSHGNL